MKKKKSPAKKGDEDIITTSVAFRAKNLSGLKAHKKHVEDHLSVSWIVNRLVEKFLASEISID